MTREEYLRRSAPGYQPSPGELNNARETLSKRHPGQHFEDAVLAVSIREYYQRRAQESAVSTAPSCAVSGGQRGSEAPPAGDNIANGNLAKSIVSETIDGSGLTNNTSNNVPQDGHAKIVSANVIETKDIDPTSLPRPRRKPVAGEPTEQLRVRLKVAVSKKYKALKPVARQRAVAAVLGTVAENFDLAALVEATPELKKVGVLLNQSLKAFYQLKTEGDIVARTAEAVRLLDQIKREGA